MSDDGERQRRLMALRRGVGGLGLLVAVVGGGLIWRAVDRVDEAWARDVVVHGEMADLEAIIEARLDEATGTAGIHLGAPTSDADLQEQLDELIEWAGADAADLADVVVSRESQVHDDAAVTGVVDERLLVGLDSALRELDREVVRPMGDEARAAHDTARRTLMMVLLVTAGLWIATLIRA